MRHNIPMSRNRKLGLVLLVGVVLAALLWVFVVTRTQTPVPETPATAALAEIPVSEPTGPDYDRDQFGARWADVDHNGCDTRNDILARDLTDVTYRDGTHECVVTSGVLEDPYTGQTIIFTRGQDTSADVQIDHVVALADAWGSGAWQWNARDREEFANDPLNLLAVDGPTNNAKGASSADQWLPPQNQCDYALRQVAVKYYWGLTMTASEKAALTDVLSDCPATALPTRQ